MSIGSRLKSYRERRNFDHKKLAAYSGISSSELIEIESGNRPLSSQEVQVLAKALEVSVDDLIGSTAETKPATESSALIPASQLAALLAQMKNE